MSSIWIRVLPNVHLNAELKIQNYNQIHEQVSCKLNNNNRVIHKFITSNSLSFCKNKIKKQHKANEMAKKDGASLGSNGSCYSRSRVHVGRRL